MARSIDPAPKAVRGFVPARNDEERYLMRHIEDLARTASSRGIARYSGFLSDREQQLAQAALNRTDMPEDEIRFDGGWPGAERKLLCLEPVDSYPASPLCCVRLQCRALPGAQLPAHKDYLGSLMGLELRREALGDIVLPEDQPGVAYVFALEPAAELICQELRQAGHTDLTAEMQPLETLPAFPQAERPRQTATVSSLRLDAVLAAMLRCSRGMKIREETTMLTPQDVRSVQFEKNLRGYRTEEVDRFLDKVEEQLTQSENEAEALRKQIADLTAENQKLRQEMKDYEADGDMLKSALINAQRMGENVIREANQKAEEILHRANLRGDDVIRDANELLQKASDRADEIINEANEKKLAEEREYDRVRLEVTRFKSDVLNLYRSHVESLSRLPEFQKEEAPAEEPEESAAEDEVEETTAELNEKLDNAADAKAPETAEADDAAEDGDEEKSEDFWEKDESQLKLDPPPADAAPTAPDYAAFQGVKFSE